MIECVTGNASITHRLLPVCKSHRSIIGLLAVTSLKYVL